MLLVISPSNAINPDIARHRDAPLYGTEGGVSADDTGLRRARPIHFVVMSGSSPICCVKATSWRVYASLSPCSRIAARAISPATISFQPSRPLRIPYWRNCAIARMMTQVATMARVAHLALEDCQADDRKSPAIMAKLTMATDTRKGCKPRAAAGSGFNQSGRDLL